MSVRRVCLALIVLAWVVPVVALFRYGFTTVAGLIVILVAVPLLTLGSLGFLTMVVLAVCTGKKGVWSAPRFGEPASAGYRLAWAVGGLLIAPSLLLAVSVPLLASREASAQLQELILGGESPPWISLGIWLCSFLGVLLATAQPRPPRRFTRPTPRSGPACSICGALLSGPQVAASLCKSCQART